MKYILALLLSGLIYYVLMYIKIDNAFKNQEKILNAIWKYVSESNDAITGIILLDSMEDYSDTIFRFTDWGYKKILPKECFEVIEPYIGEDTI